MSTDAVSVTAVPIISPASDKVHSHALSYKRGQVQSLFSGKEHPDQASKRQAEIFMDAAVLVECLPGGKLIVPVSARALIGEDNADRVLTVLRQLEDDVRQRIIVEMHDLPTNLTLDALETATIPFLLFVGGFIARVSANMDDATVFANCNYLGLSTDAMGEASGEEAIRGAWALAAPRRLKLFVWNVTSRDMVEAAQRMEVFGLTKSSG